MKIPIQESKMAQKNSKSSKVTYGVGDCPDMYAKPPTGIEQKKEIMLHGKMKTKWPRGTYFYLFNNNNESH